ncbi:hypothetical protein DFP72DRAFT_1070671 [Ephemerocybe angulata]|uniref:C2H2-type domain-containing protein n=1 Tax=Ephemerocybe angulata TaxID=980116 RepID=A0A8H6M2E7_9AGAR|nr:hypothetical protein DFP72DRAFT_1070671 [Tulosesus angulatus]
MPRDYADGLSTREINQELRRREIVTELAEFSTRDLLDAISIQLERRGKSRWGDQKDKVVDPEKKNQYKPPTCFMCNKAFEKQEQATTHQKEAHPMLQGARRRH